MGFLKKIFNLSPLGAIFYTRKFAKGMKKYKYQKKFVDFDIKKDAKVLDIGSGGEPFPFATHLMDKFPGATQHRDSKLKTNGLPFTQADVQEMPFADSEFDFVYCAHVLEHVEDPAKACEEIMRIAGRGYIELPTRLSDVTLNFARLNHFHKWHVVRQKNTLFFFEYQEDERKDTGDSEYFWMAHSQFSNPIRRTYWQHKNLFSHMFLWETKFTYYVYDTDGKLLKTNS